MAPQGDRADHQDGEASLRSQLLASSDAPTGYGAVVPKPPRSNLRAERRHHRLRNQGSENILGQTSTKGSGNVLSQVQPACLCTLRRPGASSPRALCGAVGAIARLRPSVRPTSRGRVPFIGLRYHATVGDRTLRPFAAQRLNRVPIQRLAQWRRRLGADGHARSARTTGMGIRLVSLARQLGCFFFLSIRI